MRIQNEWLREQARDQAEFARDEIRARAEVMRAQAEMRRAEIEQVRWRTRSQFQLSDADERGLMVFCPKTGARIIVSRTEPSDASTAVEVDDSF